MNKRNIVLIVVAMVVLFASWVFASDSGGPGSSGDPVVTKSYVDSKIAAIKNSSGSAAFEAVFVEAGKKLIGGSGTELILRSGSASAIDNGADGLSDLTGAKDLRQGDLIEKNHLILVPRDDGRGILAKSDIWIMVKGSGSIK